MQIAQTLNFYQEAVDQELPGVDPSMVSASDRGFGALISDYLGIALVGAGLLLLFYLVWGGIQWITSAGDKGQVEKARNKITQAIVGLLVLLASIAIFVFLQDFFGFQVLNFSSSRNSSGLPGATRVTNPSSGGSGSTILRTR